MSDKVKRRWFQFSLRTLLVAMAVFGVMLSVGGRIAFLRQRAQFHDQEAWRCIEFVLETHKLHGSPSLAGRQSLEEIYGRDGKRLEESYAKRRRHLVLAENYRSAVYHPWTIIDETMPEAVP